MRARDEFRAIHRRVRMLGAGMVTHSGLPVIAGRHIAVRGLRRDASYCAPGAEMRIRIMGFHDLLARSRRCPEDFWCYLGRVRALRSGGHAAYQRHLSRETFPARRAA